MLIGAIELYPFSKAEQPVFWFVGSCRKQVRMNSLLSLAGNDKG